MTLAWRGAVVGGVAVLMLILAANVVLPQPRPGVDPQDAWTCPLSYPIKGNFTTYSGERCIYHVSGAGFYDKTGHDVLAGEDGDAGVGMTVLATSAWR